MPPRGRGRGGAAPMGRIPSSGGAASQQQEGSGAASAGEEQAKKPQILTPYQAMQRKALLIPPLYPEVKIHKCKPISDALHVMIEQMRNSRGRIRNSPYYVDSQHCEACLDEKKDPLMQSLGIKTGYFPSEIVVRPNKKRLMMLYKRFNSGSDEANVQRLEKLFKQKKDDDDEDDDDDENGDILAEDEESDGGDAYDAFENFDDDEDYLDEEEVGDGDEGPTM